MSQALREVHWRSTVDLSIVDMLLRYEMLPMTLDVEHFAKVRLLGKIEASGEDGYSVVSDFLASYERMGDDGKVHNATKDEISRGKSSPYAASLIAKYPSFDYPAWAFMEVVTFGTFAYFYKFCAELAEFVERMNRHLGYYAGNDQVLSGFDFLTKVIGAWFPAEVAEKDLETPIKQE